MQHPVGEQWLHALAALDPDNLFVVAERRDAFGIVADDRIGTNLAHEFDFAGVVNAFPVNLDEFARCAYGHGRIVSQVLPVSGRF